MKKQLYEPTNIEVDKLNLLPEDSKKEQEMEKRIHNLTYVEMYYLFRAW